jgi:nitric oxide dioxygenase
MATDLSASTIETVQATIPFLEAQGVQIIACFYKTLFKKYPVTASFFNRDAVAPDGDTSCVPPQVAKLGDAVIAYAKHIDDVTAIIPVVLRICHMHVSRGVRAPHYTLVGECLLSAIQEVLGTEVCNAAVLEAWGSAFKFLADTFISIETGLRGEAAKDGAAGFEGYKEMIIARVVEHAPGGAKSFYLTSEDGKTPAHSCGQYRESYALVRVIVSNAKDLLPKGSDT